MRTRPARLVSHTPAIKAGPNPTLYTTPTATSAPTIPASGTSKDSEDALRFAALTGVRPMIEEAPLEDAQDAFDAMMAGRPRFRMVLTA